MIKELDFKGEKGILIESQELSVLVLPAIGGKLASIYNKEKDFELLYQNQEEYYNKPFLHASFEEFDRAGYDDCFPTIDVSKVKLSDKEVLYPDHGEIWTSSFDYSVEGETLKLVMRSAILPYEYKKEISVQHDKVNVKYSIANTGEEDFPMIWAMHCLVNAEEQMTVNFPEGTKSMENVHESQRLGEMGVVYSYPVDKDLQGNVYDFRKIRGPEADNTEKYYVAHKVEKGQCSIHYPSKDVDFIIDYDSEKLPYLGFWLSEGGFRGDYNCALEPTNGYYDSIDIAAAKGKLAYLKAQETLEFNIAIELK